MRHLDATLFPAEASTDVAFSHRSALEAEKASMRLIIATIKPSQVETVRQALAAVHVTRLTICDAQSYVPSRPDTVFQDVVLEIAVNEDFVDRAVGTLAAALGPDGPAESGRLVVLPMDDAVQIYREVRGQEAI